MNKLEEKDSFDSPYKHCLSEIKCVDTNNEDDSFRTPKLTKRIPKQPIKKLAKKKAKCKSQRIDTIFSKAKHNFYDLDVNPDHIQMAIALSESTLDQENPEESKHVNVRDSQLSFGKNDDQKLRNILERYGFRSSRSRCNQGTVINQEEAFQRRKQSRFRYTLLVSTKEHRDALIEKKISAILSQFNTNFGSTPECDIFSSILKSYHVKQSKLLKVHSFASNEDIDNYYTMSLNLPRTHSSCGSLLKDWEDIPGRELSPTRGEKIPDESLSKSLSTTNIDFGSENTHFSQSSRSSKCVSKKNTNLDLEQTFLYDSHNKNDYTCPSGKNECFSNQIHGKNEMKGKNDYINDTETKKKHNEMDLAGSTDSKQVPTFQNLDSNHQQSDMFIDDRRSISLLQKSDQSVSNKLKLNALISEENNSEMLELQTYCCSPDLFSSDDSDDVGTSEKFTNFQARLHENHDQKGIEYFESFTADTCALTEKMYKSSNPEARKNISHKMAQFDQIEENQEKSDQVVVVSDSDDDSIIIEKNGKSKEGSELNIKINCSVSTSSTSSYSAQLDNSAISISQIKNKYNLESNIQKDLCIVDIPEQGCNRNTLYTNNSGSCAELQVTQSDLNLESNEIKDNENLENLPILNEELDIKNISHGSKVQNSSSLINCLSNNLAVDIRTDSPSSSYTSRLYSPSFNINSKLNVTDYIENMLGEDCISGNDAGDGQNDKEILRSQSSNESIIISDEELNCTKIPRKINTCYDNEELDDEDASGEENIKEVKGITYNNCKLTFTPQKRSVNFNKSFNRLHSNREILNDLDHTYEPEINMSPYSGRSPLHNKSRDNQDTVTVTTPKSNLIIKTKDVTPMPDYDQMSSAEIVRELKKFRVKPLKRQRGITMLKYIYDCTHPLITTNQQYRDEEEENRILKKRRKDDSDKKSCEDVTDIKCMDIIYKNGVIECVNPEDLIFERKFRAKLAYCRIPLQIAWYNFVQSNPELKKNILLYEPLHLNSVYAMFKEQSNCKFHIEDVITFLDKKSITFRTS